MNKHTPGPWFIWKERAMKDEGLEPDEINVELLECDYFEVMSGNPIGAVSRGMIKGCNEVVDLDAEAFGNDIEEGRKIALANARLIAAAPDLLEAVAAFIKYDDGDYIDGTEMMFLYNDAINKARAAIAKATGESK